MNRFSKEIFKLAFIIVLFAAFSSIVSSFLLYGELVVDSDLIYATETISIFGVLFLVYVLAALNKFASGENSSSQTTAKTKDGKSMDQYYSSRFVSEKELKSSSNFNYALKRELHKKKDGILIRAEHKGKDLHTNMYKPIHTMVVGTTGSGKTTMYVTPSIQLLSLTKSKPSLVISDPKGELYDLHSEHLKKQGYDVKVIDLREPEKSSTWNPLDRAWDMWERAHNLHEEIKVYKDKKPKEVNPNLKTIKSKPYENVWYEFDGTAYPNKETLRNAVKSEKSKLKTNSINEIDDICITLAPVGNQQDPMWIQGAQDFIKSVLVAMLEDSLIPETGMTKDKFNFFNLQKIAMKRDVQSDDIYETLKRYFSGRDKLSIAATGGNAVVHNATNTAKGFFSQIGTALKMFNDAGINYLTSKTDIDISNFTNKPSALFIKVPDENTTRHPLANIYITQLYKIMIEMANKNKPAELPRNCYFILDEFGNLPKLEKIKSFVTAGRSRKIFLVIVVQSYTQLVSIYGEQDASTIKENCNIQIFIGTKDQKTKEEFSKSCGNIALEVENKSENQADKQDGKSFSTSKSMVTRPLIYPEELDHLNNQAGEVIVNMFREFSIRSTFTPFYNCKQFYNTTLPEDDFIEPGFLDEDAILYDIDVRNDVVLKDEDEDEFDFLKEK